MNRKFEVFGSHGGKASPYFLHGRTLIKKVQEKHIYRARWAIGVDEPIWKEYRSQINVIRFVFPDGSVREIDAGEFERRSFKHEIPGVFCLTRFVPIVALKVVREKAQLEASLFN